MLPNFLIIGSQKCGTTSLHQYLAYHPEIVMSEKKEVDFFSYNWDKGSDWYQKHFDGQAKMVGESSPSYTFFPHVKHVPERVFNTLGGQTKLIYIVRDPVERIRSASTHLSLYRKDNKNYKDILGDKELLSYMIDITRYHTQIKQYLKYFSADQIMVVSLEKLKLAPCEIMQSIFSFLDVDKDFYHESFVSAHHQSGARYKFVKYLPKDVGTGRGFVFFQSFKESLKKILPGKIKDGMKAMMTESVPHADVPQHLRLLIQNELEDDLRGLREFASDSFGEWSV